jgi:hypothetical protein
MNMHLHAMTMSTSRGRALQHQHAGFGAESRQAHSWVCQRALQLLKT